MGILSWIVVGLIAGFLAGVVVKGGGYGCIGDIVVGVIGGFLGGWIASHFFHIGDPISGNQPAVDPNRIRWGGTAAFPAAPAGWEKGFPTLKSA